MLRSTRSRVAAEMGRFPESTYETVEAETPAALATSSMVATVRLSARACVRPDGRRPARLGASAPTLAPRLGARERPIAPATGRFDAQAVRRLELHGKTRVRREHPWTRRGWIL